MQLELWNDARGGAVQRVLRRFAVVLPDLPIDAMVWSTAYDLARRARGRGLTVPAADVLIAGGGRRHGAAMESADEDLDSLGSLPAN